MQQKENFPQSLYDAGFFFSLANIQMRFAEEEERAKIHSHFAQPDYLDPDV